MRTAASTNGTFPSLKGSEVWTPDLCWILKVLGCTKDVVSRFSKLAPNPSLRGT